MFTCVHDKNDLRSAVVKEACLLLEKLAVQSGDNMRHLMRDICVPLLHLLANGNGVIVEMVDKCMRQIIKHSRFPRQIKDFVYQARSSRSKDLRESVANYILLMLREWPPGALEREVDNLAGIIRVCM
ncbi:unnamed protein product [Discosporangium mesarthrocarpum]